jgi:preprotein translocase SecE subunit
MLYRWPQGRIIRTVLFVIIALVTLDLGWGGAWSNYLVWAEQPDAGAALVNAIVLGLIALVIAVGGVIAVGFHPKSAQFLIEVEQEMAKVVWPARSELIRFTVIIAVIAIVLSVVIAVIDFLNGKIVYDFVFKLGGAA